MLSAIRHWFFLVCSAECIITYHELLSDLIVFQEKIRRFANMYEVNSCQWLIKQLQLRDIYSSPNEPRYKIRHSEYPVQFLSLSHWFILISYNWYHREIGTTPLVYDVATWYESSPIQLMIKKKYIKKHHLYSRSPVRWVQRINTFSHVDKQIWKTASQNQHSQLPSISNRKWNLRCRLGERSTRQQISSELIN